MERSLKHNILNGKNLSRLLVVHLIRRNADRANLSSFMGSHSPICVGRKAVTGFCWCCPSRPHVISSQLCSNSAPTLFHSDSNTAVGELNQTVRDKTTEDRVICVICTNTASIHSRLCSSYFLWGELESIPADSEQDVGCRTKKRKEPLSTLKQE